MIYEAYYEENNVIRKRDYNNIKSTIEKNEKNKLGCINHIRKIYYNNDINYLTDSIGIAYSNTDSFCIIIENFNLDHIILEKKCNREGTIYKSYTYLTKEQCEKLLNNDYKWLKDSEEQVMKDLFLQITINKLAIGVVVDYMREAYRINKQNDYVVFDTSIRSTYNWNNECIFTNELPATERLEEGRVVMTFKQATQIPKIVINMLELGDRNLRIEGA